VVRRKREKKQKKIKKVKILKKKRIFRIISPMPFLIAVGLIGISIVLVASIFFPYNPLDTSVCFTDYDCKWEIVNCCPETAGAQWKCVNLREFKEPSCPYTVLCPQIISPKPSFECACVQGKCAVK